jgi:hypothetical protein
VVTSPLVDASLRRPVAPESSRTVAPTARSEREFSSVASPLASRLNASRASGWGTERSPSPRTAFGVAPRVR